MTTGREKRAELRRIALELKSGTRVAGVGGDGNLYGVTTVTGGRGLYRREPCATCPWRLDSPVGRFPAQAYRESAPTAYDGAMNTFACHESGAGRPAKCAGFLLRNADNNIGVRLAIMRGEYDPATVNLPPGVQLYDSYRDMAVANGVDTDDPILSLCRANNMLTGRSS